MPVPVLVARGRSVLPARLVTLVEVGGTARLAHTVSTGQPVKVSGVERILHEPLAELTGGLVRAES
jgi:hypothetical protein